MLESIWVAIKVCWSIGCQLNGFQVFLLFSLGLVVVYWSKNQFHLVTGFFDLYKICLHHCGSNLNLSEAYFHLMPLLFNLFPIGHCDGSALAISRSEFIQCM